MKKDIQRIGNFALRYKTFIGEHKYTTYDIEIVKYYKVDKDNYENPEEAPEEFCYTIADFDLEKARKKDEVPDVISCGNRLIEAIEQIEDLYIIRDLIIIADEIFKGEEKEIQDDEKDHVWVSWTLNKETGKWIRENQ